MINLPGLKNEKYAVDEDEILYMVEKANNTEIFLGDGAISFTTSLNIDAIEALIAIYEMEDNPDMQNATTVAYNKLKKRNIK